MKYCIDKKTTKFRQNNSNEKIEIRQNSSSKRSMLKYRHAYLSDIKREDAQTDFANNKCNQNPHSLGIKNDNGFGLGYWMKQATKDDELSCSNSDYETPPIKVSSIKHTKPKRHIDVNNLNPPSSVNYSDDIAFNHNQSSDRELRTNKCHQNSLSYKHYSRRKGKSQHTKSKHKNIPLTQFSKKDVKNYLSYLNRVNCSDRSSRSLSSSSSFTSIGYSSSSSSSSSPTSPSRCTTPTKTTHQMSIDDKVPSSSFKPCFDKKKVLSKSLENSLQYLGGLRFRMQIHATEFEKLCGSSICPASSVTSATSINTRIGVGPSNQEPIISMHKSLSHHSSCNTFGGSDYINSDLDDEVDNNNNSNKVKHNSTVSFGTNYCNDVEKDDGDDDDGLLLPEVGKYTLLMTKDSDDTDDLNHIKLSTLLNVPKSFTSISTSSSSSSTSLCSQIRDNVNLDNINNQKSSLSNNFTNRADKSDEESCDVENNFNSVLTVANSDETILSPSKVFSDKVCKSSKTPNRKRTLSDTSCTNEDIDSVNVVNKKSKLKIEDQIMNINNDKDKKTEHENEEFPLHHNSSQDIIDEKDIVEDDILKCFEAYPSVAQFIEWTTRDLREKEKQIFEKYCLTQPNAMKFLANSHAQSWENNRNDVDKLHTVPIEFLNEIFYRALYCFSLEKKAISETFGSEVSPISTAEYRKVGDEYAYSLKRVRYGLRMLDEMFRHKLTAINNSSRPGSPDIIVRSWKHIIFYLCLQAKALFLIKEFHYHKLANSNNILHYENGDVDGYHLSCDGTPTLTNRQQIQQNNHPHHNTWFTLPNSQTNTVNQAAISGNLPSQHQPQQNQHNNINNNNTMHSKLPLEPDHYESPHSHDSGKGSSVRTSVGVGGLSSSPVSLWQQPRIDLLVTNNNNSSSNNIRNNYIGNTNINNNNHISSNNQHNDNIAITTVPNTVVNSIIGHNIISSSLILSHMHCVDKYSLAAKFFITNDAESSQLHRTLTGQAHAEPAANCCHAMMRFILYCQQCIFAHQQTPKSLFVESLQQLLTTSGKLNISIK